MLVTGGAWLAAYILSRILTPPRSPVPAPAAEPGPETPAVATLLTNGWKRGPEAADATLADLIRRGHVEVDPAHGTVHVSAAPGGAFTPYEQMVLDHARTRTRVADLAFRDPGGAEEWHKRFRAAVLAETRAAGLSRPRIGGPVFTVLILLGLATGIAAGLLAWRVPLVFPEQAMLAPGIGLCLWIALIWISQDDNERYTRAGADAASRWLGARVTVDRAEPSMLGVGNRDLVWSESSRRPIRITYPRTRPRHGLSLPALLLGGLGYAAFGGLVLRLSDGYVWVALPATLLLGFGLYILGRTIADVLSPRTITGEVLWRCTWRARTVEDEPDRPWLDYLAVDDGTADHTVAWALRSTRSPDVREGAVVTIRVRGWTRAVIEIRS